jgi:hypothetical protein
MTDKILDWVVDKIIDNIVDKLVELSDKISIICSKTHSTFINSRTITVK